MVVAIILWINGDIQLWLKNNSNTITMYITFILCIMVLLPILHIVLFLLYKNNAYLHICLKNTNIFTISSTKSNVLFFVFLPQAFGNAKTAHNQQTPADRDVHPGHLSGERRGARSVSVALSHSLSLSPLSLLLLSSLSLSLSLSYARTDTHTRTDAHTHRQTHTQTHRHACMDTDTHWRTHAHRHTWTHTRAQTHTDAHTRTDTHGRTHAHRHTRTHTRAQTQTHTRTHTHTQTQTHTHTRTHTHACWFLWFTGTFHRRNVFYTVQAVCAIALHLNLALTGDGCISIFPQKTHSVWL